MLTPVVTDPNKAVFALKWVVTLFGSRHHAKEMKHNLSSFISHSDHTTVKCAVRDGDEEGEEGDEEKEGDGKHAEGIAAVAEAAACTLLTKGRTRRCELWGVCVEFEMKSLILIQKQK